MMDTSKAQEIIKQTVIEYQRSTNTKKYLDKKQYWFYTGALSYTTGDQIETIKSLIKAELNKETENNRPFYTRKKSNYQNETYDSDMPWNN